MRTWEDLPYFLALARTGSLQAAAENLAVNRTTISRRVDALEKRLETKLFERRNDGLTLTPVGREIFNAAELAEGQLTEVERRIFGRDKRLDGIVRVSTSTPLADLLAPDFVAFLDRHPSIFLEVVTSNTVTDLDQRQVDVVIRISRGLPKPDTLVGRKVANLRGAIYGSVSHPDRQDRYIGWPGERRMPERLRPYLPDAQIYSNAADMMVIREMIACGAGVALLPCFLGDRDPRLRRFSDLLPSSEYQVWVLTHESLRHSARIKAFMEFMVEGMTSRHMPLMLGEAASDEPAARQTGT